MAYVHGNPKTKKALKEMVANGTAELFLPGLGTIPQNGYVPIEGPHGTHVWYASGTMQNGKLVKVS